MRRTVTEASQHFKVSEASLRTAICRGVLPAERSFGRLFLMDAAVEQYLREHKR